MEAILKVVKIIIMSAFFEVVKVVPKVVIHILDLVIRIQHNIRYSIGHAFVLGFGGMRIGLVARSFFHNPCWDRRACGGDGSFDVLIWDNGNLVRLRVFLSFLVRFGPRNFAVRRIVVDLLNSRRGNRRGTIGAHRARLCICKLVLFLIR